MNDINNILIVSAGMKLLWACSAVTANLLFSMYLDVRAGYSFREQMRVMRREPQALADYLGKRWLGNCIIFGTVFALA